MCDPKSECKIEKAVGFLAKKLEGLGKHEKPVLWHSIKVGVYLYNQNYNDNVVITGLLHDLLEDTNTQEKEIEKEFGRDILTLVRANTYDVNNLDKLKRSIAMYNNCLISGKDALLVKAADIMDNMKFFAYAKEKDKNYLLKKWKYFIKISKPSIGSENIWKKLNAKINYFEKGILEKSRE